MLQGVKVVYYGDALQASGVVVVYGGGGGGSSGSV